MFLAATLATGCAILSDPAEVPLRRDGGTSVDSSRTSPDASEMVPDDMGGVTDVAQPTDMDRPQDASTDAGTSDSSDATQGGNDMEGGNDVGGGSEYFAAVMADNPIGYWRFDDAIAPTAANAIENGVDGVYRNGALFGVPGLIEGDDDMAVELDGQDDRIELGGSFAFEGTAPFTLEAWIQPHTLDPEFQGIFSNEVQNSGLQGYGLSLTFGRLRFIRNAGGGYDLATAGQAVAVDEPSHVVVTYDGFSIVVFHNGAQVASGSGDQQMAPNDRTMMIGARSLYNGIDEFDGIIDEVAIYDYPLPPARVTAHFEAGRR